MPSSRRPQSQGFTLIELMVAAAIAGIIAAIAYPAYTSQMQRSRRTEAITALTTIMQSQERFRGNATSYASSLSALNLDSVISSLAPNYTITLAPGLPLSGVGAASYDIGYIATATPTATGKQAGDRNCKSLSVSLTGAVALYKSMGDPNNTGTNSETTLVCWPR